MSRQFLAKQLRRLRLDKRHLNQAFQNYAYGMMQQQQTASNAYLTAATSSTNTVPNTFMVGTGSITNSSVMCIAPGSMIPVDDWNTTLHHSDTIDVSDHNASRVRLPDGAVINIKPDGSYEINDSKATVVYRANRVREFNRYLNASDLLEAFIRFCGKEARVRRHEMLNLPIKLFIAWLVLEAAKADKEPEPDDIKLIPDLRKVAAPQCRSCGQFVSLDRHRAGLVFCSTMCFEKAQAALVQSGNPESFPDRTPALACQHQ